MTIKRKLFRLILDTCRYKPNRNSVKHNRSKRQAESLMHTIEETVKHIVQTTIFS